MDESAIRDRTSTKPQNMSDAQVTRKEDGMVQAGNLSKQTELSKQGNVASHEREAQGKPRYVE